MGFHTAFGSIDGLQATYWGSGNSNRTRGRSAKGTLACVFVLLKPSGQWPSRLSIFSHVLFDLGHLKVCSPVTREPSWATSRFQKGRQSRPTVAPLPVETWNNRRDLLVRSPLQIESIEDIWRYQEGEKNTPAGRTAKITLRPATSISYHSREGQNPYRHHACHACVPGNQILPLFQRSGFWWSSGSTWRSCLGTVGMVVKSISCWLITLNYHLPDGFTEFRQV